MKKVLIIGATSAIAQETAKIFAGRGDQLFLVARNEEKLRSIVLDLQVKGKKEVGYYVADMNQLERHEELVRNVVEYLSEIDVVLVAYGTLGEQKASESDYKIAEAEIKTNFLSVVSLLTLLGKLMERQQRGCIAVISSVAGDRGRRSNYVYGTAKGATSLFLQGLRNRLYESGVNVVTIKPGFVDTPMTEKIKKGMLFVVPEVVAKGIIRSIDQKKDVVYVPWFWKWIMLIIKAIPESQFKKFNF